METQIKSIDFYLKKWDISYSILASTNYGLKYYHLFTNKNRYFIFEQQANEFISRLNLVGKTEDIVNIRYRKPEHFQEIKQNILSETIGKYEELKILERKLNEVK